MLRRMQVRGTFQVEMIAEPAFDDVEGVTLSRARFDKRFEGALDATSEVHMLAVRTPVEGSGSYVAVERISGSLEGRKGTFVVVHTGFMRAGLELTIAHDSGTGELKGIGGKMQVEVKDGQHFYELDYRFE